MSLSQELRHQRVRDLHSRLTSAPPSKRMRHLACCPADPGSMEFCTNLPRGDLFHLMFGPKSREPETRKKVRMIQEQREVHRAQSLDTWGLVFDDYVEGASEQKLIEPSHQLTIGSDLWWGMLYCTEEDQDAGKAAALAEFSGLATECLFEVVPGGLSPFYQSDLVGPVLRWIELLYSEFGFLPHKNEFMPVGKFKIIGIPWDVHSMSARAIELALDDRFIVSTGLPAQHDGQLKEIDPVVSIGEIGTLVGLRRKSVPREIIAGWGEPFFTKGKGKTAAKFYKLISILPILIKQYPQHAESLKRTAIERTKSPR